MEKYSNAIDIMINGTEINHREWEKMLNFIDEDNNNITVCDRMRNINRRMCNISNNLNILKDMISAIDFKFDLIIKKKIFNNIK